MDIRKQLNDFSSLVKAEGDVLSFNVRFKIKDIEYLGDNQEELDMTNPDDLESIVSALQDEIKEELKDGFVFHFGSDDEIVVFGANMWRPYVHVAEMSSIILKILQSDQNLVTKEIFNAGITSENYTKEQVVTMILKAIPTLKVRYPSDTNDKRNYRVDFSKVKNILNFETKFSIDDGIKEIAEALKKGKFKYENEYSDNLGNYKISNEFII